MPYSSIRSPRRLAALALLAVACDPGYHIDVTVDVPEAVVAPYTETARGLLLLRREADGSPEIRAWGIVCGGAAIHWETAIDDLGFLPDTAFDAWIQALPADDARPCGASEQPIYDELAPGADDPQAHEDLTGQRTYEVSVALELAP